MNDQTEQKRRELARRVLDRIASDPQFREQLVENPHQALETSGFSKEIRDWKGSADVSGYQYGPQPPQLGLFETLFGVGVPPAPTETNPPSYEYPPKSDPPSPAVGPKPDPKIDPRIDPPV